LEQATNPDSSGLPIDGPSPLRVIGGGGAAVVGVAMAIVAPALCVRMAIEPELDRTHEGAARMQAAAQKWMLVSNVVVAGGLVLLLLGLAALVWTPGRRPTAGETARAKATRAWGAVGSVLGALLGVALVGFLSNASRWVAATSAMEEIAGRVPGAPPMGPPPGEAATMVLGILATLAYLVATALHLPIVRGLRLGMESAVPQARRWAMGALVLLSADVVSTAAAWAVQGANLVPTAIRVVALLPWPILLLVRGRAW
jgi:hypothetical protein